MLQNYQYFLTLAETLNISRAADSLFISHQCLSRYLKTLESECGLRLFERKPNLTLTYAGELLLNALRQVEHIEQDLGKAFDELKNDSSGVISLGMTAGRLRVFLPQLLTMYQRDYPAVFVKATAAPTDVLINQLLENKLDIAIVNTIENFHAKLDYRVILEESFYLVISDNLLKAYFPDTYPDCKAEFAKGVDLRMFSKVPFCTTECGLTSRRMLDSFSRQTGTSFNIVYEGAQSDFLHILSTYDYGASLCLTMYLPNVQHLNSQMPENNRLNVFPISGITERNAVYLVTQKGKYLPQYAKDLISLIYRQCESCSDAQS